MERKVIMAKASVMHEVADLTANMKMGWQEKKDNDHLKYIRRSSSLETDCPEQVVKSGWPNMKTLVEVSLGFKKKVKNRCNMS